VAKPARRNGEHPDSICTLFSSLCFSETIAKGMGWTLPSGRAAGRHQVHWTQHCPPCMGLPARGHAPADGMQHCLPAGRMGASPRTWVCGLLPGIHAPGDRPLKLRCPLPSNPSTTPLPPKKDSLLGTGGLHL
jgi:hypothetical protein